MEIIINGVMEKVPEDTNIAGLVKYFSEDDVHLIVELNGRFIYPNDYEKTTVSQGDEIEFINPNFGG